ncbi:MAG: D-alanyl-D-alanine carboxypeptidase [Clostridia bacterium]|nr:D-alanyl-D-alanine carboxypeptidase [Clostridia bacterium]
MKRLVSIFIILSIILINLTIVYADSPNINCASYILIDAKSGQVLSEYNADKRLRPASTTKIMTAVVALENGKLDHIMTASEAAVYDIGPGGMNIGIMTGEQMRMEDLLSALLIRSANETANIIAENISPTRKDFMDLMNKRVREIGAVNTYFVNPCGKDNSKEDANHLSTARDLAIITQHAMKIPKFRELVGKEYLSDMQPTNKHKKWDTLRATNKLLWGTRDYPYYMNGEKKHYTVNGVKTGYTDAAGNNLVSSATTAEGMELIAVILGVKNQASNKIFSHTKELLQYGFTNFSIQKLVEPKKFVKAVPVIDSADESKLDLITSGELSAVLPIDESKRNISVKQHLNENIKAPIKQGDVLGYLEYFQNGVSIGKIDVLASRNIEKSTVSETAEKAKNTVSNPLIRKVFTVSAVILISFIFIRMILRRVSRMVNSKKQAN